MNEPIVRSQRSAQEIHGVAEVPLGAMVAYGQALLAIAGADGVVSEAEWAYFEEHARRMGAPEPAILGWKEFDYRSADVAALVKQAFEGGVPEKKTKRVMLYDAIKMSMADGAYAEAEQAAAARAAAQLEVEEVTLRAIEGVVTLERAVADARRSIFDAG